MEASEIFRRCVERYRDLIYRIAFAYMRNAADADDVTQDVFVQLLRRTERFESEQHLRRWLVRVCVNRCKSLFRAPWRRVDDIEAHGELASSSEDGRRRELLEQIMRLPERYRIPIVLHYYAGFSTGEVAQLLHIPAATVRTRLARARARLKTQLEEVSYGIERPAPSA